MQKMRDYTKFLENVACRLDLEKYWWEDDEILHIPALLPPLTWIECRMLASAFLETAIVSLILKLLNIYGHSRHDGSFNIQLSNAIYF